MNLKFWRDINHLTVTVGLLAQKPPRQSLIPLSRTRGIRRRSQVLGKRNHTPVGCTANLGPVLPSVVSFPTGEHQVDILVTLEREEVTDSSRQDCSRSMSLASRDHVTEPPFQPLAESSFINSIISNCRSPILSSLGLLFQKFPSHLQTSIGYWKSVSIV